MKRLFALSSLLFAICLRSNAQDNAPSRDVVMYDPLFWKDKLSLKNAQSKQIEEINREFYDGLRQMRAVPYSKSEMKKQLKTGLQERSVKIWATLDNKQKKKLEKILENTSFQGS